jgi:hypothetical protein
MERVWIDVTASLMPDPDLSLGPRDSDPELAVKRIAYTLTLNPEQLEKLRAIKSELAAVFREYRAEQDKLIHAWLEELRSPPVDEAKIRARIEERERLEAGYAPRVMDKIIDFEASLSDGQKARCANCTARARYWRATG